MLCFIRFKNDAVELFGQLSKWEKEIQETEKQKYGDIPIEYLPSNDTRVLRKRTQTL